MQKEKNSLLRIAELVRSMLVAADIGTGLVLAESDVGIGRMGLGS